MSTAPVFAPDGTLGDIPVEKLQDALKAGFKPGVTMISTDGKRGVVPADRYVEAAQGGLKVAPFEEQEITHPGLWSRLGQDLLGMVKNAPSMLPPVSAYQNLQKGIDEYHTLSSTRKTQEQIHDEQQAKEGHGLLYRYLGAPTAEGIGVNVGGMEQSAREGDIGGVLGHAAAIPTVMAASEGMARGLPVAGPPIVRGAGKTYNAVRTVGQAAAPLAGIVDAGIRLSHGDLAGAMHSSITGGGIGASLRMIPRAPESVTNFGRPAPVYPGASLPEHPGTFPGAPLPETPAPEVLNPSLVSEARTLPGQISPESIRPPAQPIPTRTGLQLTGEVPEPAPAPSPAEPLASRAMERGPQPVHGESALGDILTRQDNATLLKIAKSRGINVTKESQLKPGVGDSMLVRKIIDDFSPDELHDIGAKYMEATRFSHQFGGITPEAWHTLSLGYYFPDVKIPGAVLKRSQSSMAEASNDLTAILQKSLAAAKRK